MTTSPKSSTSQLPLQTQNTCEDFVHPVQLSFAGNKISALKYIAVWPGCLQDIPVNEMLDRHIVASVRTTDKFRGCLGREVHDALNMMRERVAERTGKSEQGQGDGEGGEKGGGGLS